MSLDSLKHVERPLPMGGAVIVLDTGAVIDAEAEAMLQALHSRSVGGLRSHLEVLRKKGAQNFMQSFYVGYGHKSIGDCGSATVFIEGVSMLVAKAIQDTMLYSGQEASTRYIDFARQPFLNPLGTPEGQEVLEEWRRFYVEGLELVVADVARRFPRKDGEDEKTYEKAVKARAFDIIRGFLPAGASTNLAWHTNLRQFADHLTLLRNHTLSEVRTVAEAIEDALKEMFPNSFGQKHYPDTEAYYWDWMEKGYYLEQPRNFPDFALNLDGVDRSALSYFKRFLVSRPPKAELPKKVGVCGTMRFHFTLDFGSFRDLERHRSLIQMMPLVTMQHGFHEWYLSEMPDDLRERAQKLLKNQEQRIHFLNIDLPVRQYYIPMGYKLPIVISGDLPALVYVCELRSGSTVHPTLRIRAQQIARVLENRFGDFGLKLYADQNPTRFDIKRGEHDIVMKS